MLTRSVHRTDAIRCREMQGGARAGDVSPGAEKRIAPREESGSQECPRWVQRRRPLAMRCAPSCRMDGMSGRQLSVSERATSAGQKVLPSRSAANRRSIARMVVALTDGIAVFVVMAGGLFCRHWPRGFVPPAFESRHASHHPVLRGSALAWPCAGFCAAWVRAGAGNPNTE